MENFSAAKLRARMAENDTSVSSLAGDVGVTISSVSRWRRGIGAPTFAKAGKIAAALECSICDLVEAERAKSKRA